jgi:hypothetical protein
LLASKVPSISGILCTLLPPQRSVTSKDGVPFRLTLRNTLRRQSIISLVPSSIPGVLYHLPKQVRIMVPRMVIRTSRSGLAGLPHMPARGIILGKLAPRWASLTLGTLFFTAVSDCSGHEGRFGRMSGSEGGIGRFGSVQNLSRPNLRILAARRGGESDIFPSSAAVGEFAVPFD